MKDQNPQKIFKCLPTKNTLRDRVDQGLMATKWYSTFPKAPELRLQHQIDFVLYPGHSSCMGILVFCREAIWGWCPRGVMIKVMDCGIVVREFVLQSRYYVDFRTNTLGKSMKPLILPAMG